jgi:hypothetical protein
MTVSLKTSSTRSIGRPQALPSIPSCTIAGLLERDPAAAQSDAVRRPCTQPGERADDQGWLARINQPVAQRLPVEPWWGVRAVNVGFRLLSGATAPHAKATGVCVEIVFVGIRLCDKLKHPLPPCADMSSSRIGGARQLRRNLASGGQAVGSQHRRAPRPTVTSRTVPPHRVDGRRRATRISGITLSKWRRSGRTRAEPPIWAAVQSLAWSRMRRPDGKSAWRAGASSTAA